MIDIEILGKDTTKVQLNYYTDGVGKHEYMYDLGFDSSEAFHTYGFDWHSIISHGMLTARLFTLLTRTSPRLPERS